MRNSPDGQILGHPSSGIPRRALWWLIALVVLAHAALLLDVSTLSRDSGATTQVAAGALASPSTHERAQESEDSNTRLTRIRWVGTPVPPPTPEPSPAPAPSETAPKPTAPEGGGNEPEEPPLTTELVTSEEAVTEPETEVTQTIAEPEPVAPEPLEVPSAQTRLVYEITGLSKGRNIFADGQFEWTVEGDRYEASLAVRMVLLGTRTQTSVGRIGPQGLKPDRFGERQRDETATHFDYEGQRVRFSRNRPDAPLLPGTQDRLSVILQLAALMQARPSDFEVGSEVNMPVASSRAVEDWRWQVGDLETLVLPKGSMIARRLTRPALHERDNTVELWMAPSLQHLPIRIRITQRNGDWLDQRLVLAP
ncbi:MAG: DUF3108 domain-containing protein [Hydrogenophaga sp.]|nr:DUF3108 domain-containing protein [Hydrogenophaga sp.]